MNRSKRSFNTIISDNQPVIEWYFLAKSIIDLAGFKRFGTALDLRHQHQISICFFFIIIIVSGFRLTPAIVEL